MAHFEAIKIHQFWIKWPVTKPQGVILSSFTPIFAPMEFFWQLRCPTVGPCCYYGFCLSSKKHLIFYGGGCVCVLYTPRDVLYEKRPTFKDGNSVSVKNFIISTILNLWPPPLSSNQTHSLIYWVGRAYFSMFPKLAPHLDVKLQIVQIRVAPW